MSGFFNNCAESGAYKENPLEEHGFLVCGIKYCHNLKEVQEFTGIRQKRLKEALAASPMVVLDRYDIRLVPKRRISGKRVCHNESWHRKQSKMLNGTDDIVTWRR